MKRSVLVWVCMLAIACDDVTPTTAPDAAVDADSLHDAGDPRRYPRGRDETPETCAEDLRVAWPAQAPPASCAGRRVCIDEGGRVYRDGEPWIPRGVYHGGQEVETLLTNCPAGAACAATQPADHAAYVDVLAEAGIELILEHRDALSPPLYAAIAAHPRVGFAHLLFGDPFTVESHDAMAAQIDRVAADPELLWWMGPDEPDLNGTWPMATGIARLLRGASSELDALLAGRYAPSTPMPYLPADEPAHDPGALPYASAVVIDDTGLAVAHEVYDAFMPVTYPYQEPTTPADSGLWTIERISRFGRDDTTRMPILQMVELAGLRLIHPSPAQIRALILGALVHGAQGALYFKVAGDDPPSAGRDGYFAADDVEGWAAYQQTHALWDRLIPVLYSDATSERSTLGPLHVRTFTRGSGDEERRVVLMVNPTPYERWVDVDMIVRRRPDERVRSFQDCAPFVDRALRVEPYATLVLEVVGGQAPVEVAPGDPLAGTRPSRPEPGVARERSGPWQRASSLPTGRSSHFMVARGAELWIGGGYAGTLAASIDVFRFDPRSGALGDLPWLFVARASASAGLLRDALFVAGGVPAFATTGSPVRALSSCERVDDVGAASCDEMVNGATSSGAFLTFDESLYVFGGTVSVDREGGDLVTTVVQRFDSARERWQAETHLPELRVGGAAFEHAGVAYLAGGFAQSAPGAPVRLVGRVSAYDLIEQRWLDESGMADMPTPRAALACVALDAFAYCIGGYDAAGDALATVERLDLSSGTWTAIESLPEPRTDLAAVALDGALVVSGGVNASFVDSAEVYTLE